jgi:hypothetical protein
LWKPVDSQNSRTLAHNAAIWRHWRRINAETRI